MQVVAQRTLKAHWETHPETEPALRHWLTVAKAADWQTMADVRAQWSKAKVLNGERVRFEVSGGDYRLIVAIYFPAKTIWVKFIGTHAEYDRVDALTMDQF